MSKIVIPGGTGFVGEYCVPRFRASGHDVIIVSRQEAETEPATGGTGSLTTISWSDNSALIDSVNGAAMVINLAGKSVDCRYNERNKAEILSSRVDTTREVGQAIVRCENPPPLWMNASTATIYRDSLDEPMTEANGDIGEGFSVGVGLAWEKALNAMDLPQTRRVALRISIILGRSGGMMGPSKVLVRLGLGGHHGSGEQMFSWIHMEDFYRALLFIQEHEDIAGPVNLASPEPVTNDGFMKALRRAMKMPIGLPATKWMLEIGAFFLGTETELLLKSRYVLPEKLLNAGFKFEYPGIDEALKDLVGSKDIQVA